MKRWTCSHDLEFSDETNSTRSPPCSASRRCWPPMSRHAARHRSIRWRFCAQNRLETPGTEVLSSNDNDELKCQNGLATRSCPRRLARSAAHPAHQPGVMASPEIRTPEGRRMQFATDYFGHFGLGKRLHRPLAAREARVVSVSSGGGQDFVRVNSSLVLRTRRTRVMPTAVDVSIHGVGQVARQRRAGSIGIRVTFADGRDMTCSPTSQVY